MLLYIDPGTGSMLFTVLVSVMGATLYSLRLLVRKIGFAVTGGKVEKSDKKIPLVIFAEEKRYWSIFEGIIRELDARGKEVVYMTMSEDDPAFDAPYEKLKTEFIGVGNKAYAKLNFLNAGVVLATTPGLDVYQWKRSKDVDYYVHIPHAPNDITRYRMFGIDYYDAILLSGDYQGDDIRDLEKQRNLPEKELYKVGVPYMDAMAERYQAFKTGDGELNEKAEGHDVPTVLLAPSWGSSAIFKRYGSKLIDQLIATGYNIIIRPHPQSFISDKDIIDELMKKYPDGDKVTWNKDRDNFDVLNKADILIADFSGVIFDFTLIYDKPIIYTNPEVDLGLYDAWWLDRPTWTQRTLPTIGRELKDDNMENVKELIDQCLKDEAFAKGRENAKKETWAYVGQGAVKAAEYLIKKCEEIEKSQADGCSEGGE